MVNETKHAPDLIVMLTYEDLTVENAEVIFEECQHSKAQYWGIKEQPLPLQQMKRLFSHMKACGKTTCLEVVAYTEQEGLDAAQTALECGCDILMGTCFFDSVLAFCQTNQLKYMPFVGTVTGRPSVLEGTVENIVAEAQQYVSKGVFGIDLLGFRYVDDPARLIQAVVQQVQAPVCVAGSIDSYQKLDVVKQVCPWTFTIGSAFFNKCFGKSFQEQIDKVCDYVKRSDEVVDYYDRIAQSYDESRFENSYGKFIDFQERKVMDKLTATSSNSLRLDLGCGTGRLSNYATHGLDASAEMLEIAKERHPTVEFHQASAIDTGFPDNLFDTVYAFHLLMHLDETVIDNIFTEVYRILKPNGNFIFDIPSKKRRHLVHQQQASWHGGTAFCSKEILQIIDGKYQLEQSFGIMMAPVHKLPVKLRRPLQKMDFAIANSWLKEYSSYLVFNVVKK